MYYGEGQGDLKDNVKKRGSHHVASIANKIGHTRENCWKLHGRPPNARPLRGQNHDTSSQKSVEEKPDVSTSSIVLLLNNQTWVFDLSASNHLDALRLYLINSPVVRAESLNFKKEGVYTVVKDVFLPWYNAYRFLIQNAKRLEAEGFSVFTPLDRTLLQNSSNVLDQWINSATESLVHFVRREMNAYRLYTVVPYLLRFIDNLTNIYVRFNRKRLKGRTGEEDCRISLSTLYHVLLTTCIAMAPFTPFFTETLFQNLRKVSNGLDESIHHCAFPSTSGKRDERIEQSVTRMMTVIDLARNIREQNNKPLKTPLREMIVVHPDAEFLEDITVKLKEIIRTKD
ncbi:hypothetical protein HPP92_012341 [Vanilla planifolia]|uniref:Methionyl/Valyl/Leucyl/Isoleucyl-tRNA synthetase anticodon-binding domain-containing protein n=1 Tax=Vanilla planifolia TaxID=51239 RepID=A0A835R0R9_VANPL|nr:hypothetical protein HPP92_012341 [Vanilla planifolia]